MTSLRSGRLHGRHQQQITITNSRNIHNFALCVNYPARAFQVSAASVGLSNRSKRSKLTMCSNLSFSHHSRLFSSSTATRISPPTSSTQIIFDRNVKRMQRNRAALGPESRDVDYLRDEVADRLVDRLLVNVSILCIRFLIQYFVVEGY